MLGDGAIEFQIRRLLEDCKTTGILYTNSMLCIFPQSKYFHQYAGVIPGVIGRHFNEVHCTESISLSCHDLLMPLYQGGGLNCASCRETRSLISSRKQTGRHYPTLASCSLGAYTPPCQYKILKEGGRKQNARPLAQYSSSKLRRAEP